MLVRAVPFRKTTFAQHLLDYFLRLLTCTRFLYHWLHNRRILCLSRHPSSYHLLVFANIEISSVGRATSELFFGESTLLDALTGHDVRDMDPAFRVCIDQISEKLVFLQVFIRQVVLDLLTRLFNSKFHTFADMYAGTEARLTRNFVF